MGNWDNDIDEVARQMTEGGPGANFKVQVLARIDALNSRRGRRRLAFAAAVAVAATGAMVFMSIRPVWKTDTVRLKPDTSDTVLREPDTTYGEHPESGTPTNGALKRGTEDRTSRVAAAGVSQGGSHELSGFSGTGALAPRADDRSGPIIVSDVDRLQPLPIQVEQLAVDAMEKMDAIQVQRLDIAPLDVPALAIALLHVPVLGDESLEGRIR